VIYALGVFSITKEEQEEMKVAEIFNQIVTRTKCFINETSKPPTKWRFSNSTSLLNYLMKDNVE